MLVQGYGRCAFLSHDAAPHTILPDPEAPPTFWHDFLKLWRTEISTQIGICIKKNHAACPQNVWVATLKNRATKSSKSLLGTSIPLTGTDPGSTKFVASKILSKCIFSLLLIPKCHVEFRGCKTPPISIDY